MTQIQKRKGIMIVLSSPSGGGKTTIAHALLKEDTNIRLSISVTTREPRGEEVNGKDYFFVSTKEFIKLRDSGMLIEHAEVFGNYYGIPKKETEDALKDGTDVMFVIDWKGAESLISQYPEYVISIFMLPPSIDELERRLVARGTDTTQTIKKRIEGAKLEISKQSLYDYVIVNNTIRDSLDKIKNILQVERDRRK